MQPTNMNEHAALAPRAQAAAGQASRVLERLQATAAEVMAAVSMAQDVSAANEQEAAAAFARVLQELARG